MRHIFRAPEIVSPYNSNIVQTCAMLAWNRIELAMAHPSWMLPSGTPKRWQGKGVSRKVRALVSEDEPKMGGRGAYPGNWLVPRPLNWLKMILRMFQLTETMFFWGFFLAISIVLVVKVMIAFHEITILFLNHHQQWLLYFSLQALFYIISCTRELFWNLATQGITEIQNGYEGSSR